MSRTEQQRLEQNLSHMLQRCSCSVSLTVTVPAVIVTDLITPRNTCSSGAPLQLLWVGMFGEDERAQRVRQLLLESPSFERGLLAMVDTWLDVLHMNTSVRISIGTCFAAYCLVGMLRHTCMAPA
jgi:hypothetical protein